MEDDDTGGHDEQRGDAWYRRLGAALDARFSLHGKMARRLKQVERERALLIPPPVSERFTRRLADLGFARHGEGQYVTPPLRNVPAGPFPMGSDSKDDADAQDNELPQHLIEIGPYRIGAYPVTVAEYDCAVRAGIVREPRYFLITWLYQLQRLDAPAVCISWADATAYAAWLARTTGQAWRLPTEAQWEKAARGTDGRRYPWGNQWDSSRANVDKIDAWYFDHDQKDGGEAAKGTQRPSLAREKARHPELFEEEPTPIGAFAEKGDASPYGAHDLAGNVWEWTSSLFRPYPYAPHDGREDPTAAGTRVLRGGSWGNSHSEARVTNRNGNAPVEPDDGMGFRLVLDGDPRSR